MIPIRSMAVSGVALSEIDGETKILLMKRCRGNFWCHVAGTIEADEKGWQTIIREFKEETQLEVTELYNGQYLEKFYESSLNTIEVIPVFVVYCQPNQAIIINDEHTDHKWCSLSEALELSEFPGQKLLYEYIWYNFVEIKPSKLMRVKVV
ncbi:NUDIX hydrolase [Moritella dasanensis]|uniref:NUDIX hydrolase n=1 Tax=Moritella dasanensis TaxID=428031 RepID=UPI00036889E9|nr:NUDIX domain-containing protein [Moritella dasanensis]